MTLSRIARVAAYLVLAALAAQAAYYVLVGVPVTSYAAVPPGQPLGPGQTSTMPYFPALYVVPMLLLIGVGLARDRWLRLAWIGILLLLALGALLIFTLGIFYVAAAGGLTLLVGLIHWRASGRTRWLAAAAAGAGVVLVVGWVMLGTVYGYPLLGLGFLLAGVLATVIVSSRSRARQSVHH